MAKQTRRNKVRGSAVDASALTAARAVWPGILAALIIIGLLVSFHQVVRGAVQQGESRRKATATRVEAVWRCNALRSLAARAECLLPLNAPTRDDVHPPLQNVTTVATTLSLPTDRGAKTP